MSLLKRKQNKGSDNLQTPVEALNYLIPYLKKEWTIWEPACGNGNLVKGLENLGYKVIGTDILSGTDYLATNSKLEDFDRVNCIITNPPFRHKDEFLKKCYELKKPFALLLPITALEGIKRQKLYRENGLEIIFLPKRIDFTGKKAPWFAVAWFTWGLNIGKDLTFTPIK